MGCDWGLRRHDTGRCAGKVLCPRPIVAAHRVEIRDRVLDLTAQPSFWLRIMQPTSRELTACMNPPSHLGRRRALVFPARVETIFSAYGNCALPSPSDPLKSRMSAMRILLPVIQHLATGRFLADNKRSDLGAHDRPLCGSPGYWALKCCACQPPI